MTLSILAAYFFMLLLAISIITNIIQWLYRRAIVNHWIDQLRIQSNKLIGKDNEILELKTLYSNSETAKFDLEKKFKFMQCNKPKYNVGDNFGSIEIVKLDVKLFNIFGVLANFAMGMLCSFLFGTDKVKKENITRFVYIIKNMAAQEPVEETVEETYLDELKAKLPKRSKK